MLSKIGLKFLQFSLINLEFLKVKLLLVQISKSSSGV